MRAGLEARGHTVVSSGTLVSGLHGIVRNAPRGDGPPPPFSRHPGRGLWAGGADPRREGVARGSGAAASEAALGSDAVHDGDAARNGEAVRAGE